MKFNFGIEIHIQLPTKSKVFSNGFNYLNSVVDKEDIKYNNNIASFDLGHPGIKPTVNKKVIELAYRVSKSLNMDISNIIYFDRKNYFYYDSANNYQITQFANPIGRNGYIEISTLEGKYKKIKIERLQIEHDTARKIHLKDNSSNTYLDFNRSGVPLLELVTDYKDLETIEEVMTFINNLKNQLVILNLFNESPKASMFRFDLNISLKGSETSRVEIKNVTNFKNVKQALINETKELERKYKLGELKENHNQTKKYDDKTGKNILMREKQSDNKYNYIREGNILPILIDDEAIINWESNFKIYKISSVTMKYKDYYDKIFLKKIFSSYLIFLQFINSNDKLSKPNFIKKIIDEIFKLDNKRLMLINFNIINFITKLDIEEILSNKEINVWFNFIRNFELKSMDDSNLSNIIKDKLTDIFNESSKASNDSVDWITDFIKNLITNDKKIIYLIETKNFDKARKIIISSIFKERGGSKAIAIKANMIINEFLNNE